MSSTDIILIAILAVLLINLHAINKIGAHIDTIRRIAWDHKFGEPPKD